MANQTLYTLSLNDDPIPDINSELVELAKNLEMVNVAFNSMKGFFAAFKSFSAISNHSLQNHFSSTFSNSGFSSPPTSMQGFSDFSRQTDEFHTLSKIASGTDNLYKMGKYASGDLSGGEATTFGRGLAYTDNALSATSDFSGFLEDTALEVAGGSVLGEAAGPILAAYGIIQLIADLQLKHGTLSPVLKSSEEFTKATKALQTPMSYDSFPYLNLGQENALFGPSSMKIDHTFATDTDRSIFKTNNNPENTSQPINTTPCGCNNTQTVIITNNYTNLIGQLTITNSKLDMDLSQVKELVSEAIVQSLTQSAQDFHVTLPK